MGENASNANASSAPALVAGLSELQSLLVGTDAVDELVGETAMLVVRAGDTVDECGVDREQLDEQLHQAVSSRAEIDQTNGILMAKASCGPDEAFDLLRRASQNRNVKLRDLGAQTVDHTARSR